MSSGFAFAADLHIKRQNWATRPDIRGDAYYAFEQIVGWCVANNSSLVLGGDIFDTAKPASVDIEAFRAGVKRLTAAGCTVFVVQGQHDKSVPPWPVAVVDDVQYVHNKVFEPCSGMRVMAFDWTAPEQQGELLRGVPPDVSTVVLHQLARPAFNLDGSWDFDPTWLPPHVKLLLMGDLHKDIAFGFGTDGRGYYSGSIHMCAIDENPRKSFMYVENTGEVTRVPLVTRDYMLLGISSEQQCDEVLHQVKTLLDDYKPPADIGGWSVAQPVVVAEYLASVPHVQAKFRDVVGDRAGFWPKPVSVRLEEASTERVVDRSEDAAPDTEACLKRIAGTDAAKELVRDLLKRPPSEVFAEWRVRMGVETATA
jgi:hypothetical protein